MLFYIDWEKPPLSSIIYIVIFFAVWYLQSESILDPSGRNIGYWVQCYYLGTPMLITVLLKQSLIHRHWVWVTYTGLLISLILDPLVHIVVENIGLGSDPGTFVIQHSLFTFWLTLVLIPVLCLLPDVSLTLGKRMFFPSDADIIMEHVALEREMKKAAYKGRRKVQTSFSGSYDINDIEMDRVSQV